MPEAISCQSAPLLTKEIADRAYELYRRNYEVCGSEYEIWRWCGLSFSRYHMSAQFTPDEFDIFVNEIDETLLMRSCDLFADFFEEIKAVNSKRGILADHSFGFRLMEYARHRCSILKQLGALEVIYSDTAPADQTETLVRTAFELGMATAEYRLVTTYEGYIYDGMALEDWREAGLPKAKAERLRQGARTRAAVVKAAKRLYALDGTLIRNDLQTARRILKLDLPELQKGNGIQIGLDAVTRHLRAARKAGAI